jgi:para-nitrobenzyl esterase
MIRKSIGLLFGLVAIYVVTIGSAATVSAAGSLIPPIALTESGLVIGSTTNGVNEFLGIPYAVPPVGARRWTPPKPYGLFHGLVLQATQFGSECTQPGPSGSENCLFLNVYTPKASVSDGGKQDLPVMVWIHGGALVNGGGDLYDPTRLVRKGVIVVTMNYRLGYLGFFAQSALDAEGHLSGNYGLLDQQLALKWVQKNIEGFGGDPRQVTIFGESAGGQSVYVHLASPIASHLFRAAISESGSYFEFQDYLDFIVTLANGETAGTALVPSGSSIATSVGCSSQTSACLRAVPASAMVAVEPSAVYPFVDGTLLTQTPGAAFAKGQFNHVPVISGINHDEWRYFVALQYDLGVGPLTDGEYPAAVAATQGLPVGDSFVQFLINTEYPLSNYPPPSGVASAPLALGALGTDDFFACPARNADLLLSHFVPTYAYEFNDETAPSFLPPLSFPLGDAHFIEVQYLFGLEAFGITPTFTPDQQKLSDTMIGYWTQFAKTGNPNSSGTPKWSSYGSNGSFESLIAPTPLTESDTSFDTDHKCSSFWNTF